MALIVDEYSECNLKTFSNIWIGTKKVLKYGY